jgi:hypothetical protein
MKELTEYYADLNPRYPAKGEKRYAVFHRLAGMLPNASYTARYAAIKTAMLFTAEWEVTKKRLNI